MNSKGENDTKTEEAKSDQAYPQDEIDPQFEAVRLWLISKFKDSKLVEIVGIFTGLILVILGIIGAFIYYGQLQEMRHANDINTRALIATQSAAFNCQSQLQPEPKRFVVECRNQGLAPARDLEAKMTFSRFEDGKQVQTEGWTITRSSVVKMDEFAFIIPVPSEQPNWDWISHQSMQANIIFAYSNGIERVSEKGCWALFRQLESRSWGVTDCDNARSIDIKH